MLIRHAILEMFKYLEPDWNHTPPRIKITRLQIAQKHSRIIFLFI